MTAVPKGIPQIAALTAVLYAARRYYRNWGATKGESQLRLPGDELVGDPVIQVTEAVWIEAPPATIWPLLLQIGQNRGEERQQLAAGDVLRLTPQGWMGLRDGLSLRVDAVTPEHSIVLRAVSPNLPKLVWSFHLQPHWDHHTRLLARARVGLRHPGEVFAVELARPAITLMTRAVLLGMKRRAERQMNYLATSEFYC
jgi:hypothetical protein